MYQISVGYIPENWEPNNNEYREGYITIGDDSSGIISDFVNITEVFDGNGESLGFVVGGWPSDDFHPIFIDNFPYGEDSEKFYSIIYNTSFENLKSTSFPINGLRLAYGMVDNDIDDINERAHELGFEDPICVCGPNDGAEFSNKDKEYNGFFIVTLRDAEQMENDEDGYTYIFKPLPK